MEEQIGIKNTTYYNKDTYIGLNIVLYKLKIFCAIICNDILIIAGLLMIVFDYSLLFGLICIGCAVVLIIFILCLYYKSIKKSIKMNLENNGDNLKIEYEFFKNSLIINSFPKNNEIHKEYKYTDYYKIKSDKNYMYLFISNNQAHCVAKNGFKDDDLNKVLEMIKKK